MLVLSSDSATITGNVIITVNARSIKAEARCSDSGVNLKIYAAGLRLIYYLVRFCIPGSVHSLIGQLGVSAYTFDDSNRAYASVRVGLRRIAPVFRENEQGEIQRTDAVVVQEDVGTALEPIKLKFILYKYVIENWEDDTKVLTRRVSKESFARQVQLLFDTLQQRSLILVNMPNVVIFEDRVVEPAVLQGLRPTAEVLASGRLTVARYNEQVSRTNFSLEAMSLNNLVASNLPFDITVFRTTNPRANNPRATTVRNEADETIAD